jgi:hypothetical protein
MLFAPDADAFFPDFARDRKVCSDSRWCVVVFDADRNELRSDYFFSPHAMGEIERTRNVQAITPTSTTALAVRKALAK